MAVGRLYYVGHIAGGAYVVINNIAARNGCRWLVIRRLLVSLLRWFATLVMPVIVIYATVNTVTKAILLHIYDNGK